VTTARLVSSSFGRAAGVLLIAGVALLAPRAHAQPPVPPLEQRVTDLTGTLSAEQRAALETKLEAFEAETGSQIAVLMLPTTQPETIEQYGIRVAEEWQIGRGGVDDGVVLLVAKDDRRLRIEVGYGLEGAVPDALARRIIAERIVPRFYEDDYAGGVDAGAEALMALIRGEGLPAPAAPQNQAPDAWGAVPLLLMLAAVLAPMFRRMFGTLLGSVAVGGAAGFFAWLMSNALFVALAVGGMVFLFALAGIGGGPGRWASGRHGGWAGGRHGGFGGGGGFRGGGGGFRGGGGRFGGGGASGGW
jgi:uncharacterized protein